MMESNQKNKIDDSEDIVHAFVKVMYSESINYLYHNVHRITHQMRWFKSNRDSGFKSYMNA